MKIANFQKVTLQDYPDKIASICFMKGCNLRCPYCHNPSLVFTNLNDKKDLNTKSEFIKYLSKRKDILEGVVISGGEPLIHEDLIDLLVIINKLGLKVKLDTNGMFPQRLKVLLDQNLIDYVALDYKGSLQTLNKAVGIKETSNLSKKWFASLKILINFKVDYELRTTVVKGIHCKKDLILMAEELKNQINQPISKWFIQSFENKDSLLINYTDNKIKMSAYNKDELKAMVTSIKKIIKNVKLRN